MLLGLQMRAALTQKDILMVVDRSGTLVQSFAYVLDNRVVHVRRMSAVLQLLARDLLLDRLLGHSRLAVPLRNSEEGRLVVYSSLKVFTTLI
jgi:hypothetical protein